jgi:hypothetical protein
MFFLPVKNVILGYWIPDRLLMAIKRAACLARALHSLAAGGSYYY